MTCLRTALVAILLFLSLGVKCQTAALIGTSEEFILENVKGYSSVEERGVEHEEFDVLVFEDTDRELSFYFTFYRGEKICNYIKNKGTLSALKDEITFIKSHYTRLNENTWENAAKTARVELTERDGQVGILVKEIRN